MFYVRRIDFSFTSMYGYCPLSEEEQMKQADETGVDAILSDFLQNMV